MMHPEWTMTAQQVLTDHERCWRRFRRGGVELHEPRLSVYQPARSHAIPTVQHLALKRQNRLALAVLPNIIGKRLKFIVRDRWK